MNKCWICKNIHNLINLYVSKKYPRNIPSTRVVCRAFTSQIMLEWRIGQISRADNHTWRFNPGWHDLKLSDSHSSFVAIVIVIHRKSIKREEHLSFPFFLRKYKRQICQDWIFDPSLKARPENHEIVPFKNVFVNKIFPETSFYFQNILQ